ncbi:phage head closure protein [Pseudomonas asiatica]|uniref:phage head closure protein n=1 Tax=Pseudomonas asiatica TaxID=2219225 RepID=UPI00209B0ADB|nr:phage head closure protein [Pseudomonas asiatica]MCO7527378.1 phage head closure protein [Pseudomonas asiatica]
MLAGKLRYPVTIERPVDTRTPGGGFIRTWEPVSREWADIESISGSEFIAAQAPQSQTVFRIRIRYRDTWYRAGAYAKGRRSTKSLPCCRTLAAGGSS